MPYEAVDATASQALDGLYLTPDLWFSANYLTPHLLAESVTRMHITQPLTTDFETFAEKISIAHELWKGGAYRSPPMDTHGHLLGDLMMMATDLCTTYMQIRRGLTAATDLAMAIFLRSINQTDVEGAQYAPVFPAALETMRINGIEDINVKTFRRILAVEPWVSWLERLRAQQQRSKTSLLIDNAPLALVEGVAVMQQDIAVTRQQMLRLEYRANRATRKTIRKSVGAFDRILGIPALKAFLRSADFAPLRIEGYQYNYHLNMRRKSLFKSSAQLNTGVSTVETAVYNKKGERLCELCHYFQDTPVLDAVIATVLNVRNEETELDLLRQACVIDTPKAFYADPVLPNLKSLHDPATAPTFIQNVFNYAYGLPAAGESTFLRRQIRKDGLPMAYQAFKAVNRVGKQYFPLMRMCGGFGLLEYLSGELEPMLYMELIQRTIQNSDDFY